jgi:hypothetical protein
MITNGREIYIYFREMENYEFCTKDFPLQKLLRTLVGMLQLVLFVVEFKEYLILSPMVSMINVLSLLAAKGMFKEYWHTMHKINQSN